MAIILSLLAAIAYGAGDFAGGLVSKRNVVLRVVVLSQLIGIVPLIVAFAALNEASATPTDLLWGAGAGVGGSTGVILLYRGLAIGRMSIVAPITAVETAALPVIFGLVTGERPSTVAMIGVGVAVAAVALLSSAPDRGEVADGRASGLPEALGAGFAFAVFFIMLDGAGDDSGMWPALSMRITSLLLVAVVVIVTRTTLRPTPGTTFGIALAGILSVAADVSFLLSTRHGLLSVVAVITSLYPAVTVVLARAILKERLLQIQVVGLALGAIAVTLIATG